MPIKVRIPEPLRKLTAGADVVAVEATNVAQMIEALEARHPGIKERICDENGKVRNFVNVFVNEEDIRFLQNLETPLDANSEVSILPAIAGGAAKTKAKSKRNGAPAAVATGKLVRRVYLTFDEETTKRPMIYELIRRFDVVPNIKHASATEKVAIMGIEFSGDEQALEQAFNWLRREGVRVDPIEMNVLEP